MLATLIGVFLTSTAIVIAADSAVSGPAASANQKADKICQTSSRSVATMQGEYFFQADNGFRASLYEAFKRECESLRRSQESIAKQADSLIQSLHAEFLRFVQAVPGAQFSSRTENDPHLAYIAVAGYQGSTATIEVRELRFLRSPLGGFHILPLDVPALRPIGCGARFHGNDIVANLLLQDDDRISARDRARPEVVQARRANDGDCRTFTPGAAKALFATAAKLTIRDGHRFGIPSGTVAGPLKFAVIRPSGKIHVETRQP